MNKIENHGHHYLPIFVSKVGLTRLPFLCFSAVLILALGPLAIKATWVNADKKSEDKKGKILLLIEAPAGKRLSESGEVERLLSKKLVDGNLSVTSISEINEKDATRLRQAIQKLQQGDKKASNSIPFSVIVTGNLSVSALSPFNELYMAEATITLKAVNTINGRTISIESLSGVRSYGNSQEHANKNALKDAAERISEKFVKQIADAAR